MAAKFLYFDPGSDNSLTMPVDRLLSIDQTGNTEILMTFEDKDGTAGSRTFATLAVDGGTEKAVMQSISEAIAFSKDQFVVIADTTNSNFINASITGVAINANVVSSTGLMSAGTGADGGDTYKSSVKRVGNIIETTIIFDLDGLASTAADGNIVGEGTEANASIAKLTSAINGSVFHLCEVTCVEAIGTGEPDLHLVGGATEADAAGGAVSSGDLLADFNGDITLGAQTRTGLNSAVVPTLAKPFLFLRNGHGSSDAATYTSGKLMIKIIGEV